MPAASKKPELTLVASGKENATYYEDAMSSFKCPMPDWGTQQQSSAKRSSDGDAAHERMESPSSFSPTSKQYVLVPGESV